MAEVSPIPTDFDMDSFSTPDPPASRKTRSKGKGEETRETPKKGKSDTKAQRANVRAGLVLSSARVKRIMMKCHKGKRMRKNASIFMTAAAEYFIEQLVDNCVEYMGKKSLEPLPANADIKAKKKYNQIAHKRLHPRIINIVAKRTPVFARYLKMKNALIIGGGVLQTAADRMEREKEFRKQIKNIKAQGYAKIKAIREQSKQDSETPSKKQKKKKSKKADKA